MSPIAAWLQGIRRVRRAWPLLLALWLLTVAITSVPAVAMHDAIKTHLGQSLEADAAADGVNYDWLDEFRASSPDSPIVSTLRADVIGFAAVMDNTSALADAASRSMVVVLAGIVYVGLLWFLAPGIVHQLAAGTPVHMQGFFARCGACASRMLRLGLVAGAVYAVLFGAFHEALFDDLLPNLTREVTVERTAFFARLATYVVFFALVVAVNLLFDFAKVRMVVEDRHSVLASIASAGEFVGGNPRLALGVYGLNVATFAIVLAIYAAVAPGAGTAAWWSLAGGFAVGQCYVLARLFVKLAFWAGEAAALQFRLGPRLAPEASLNESWSSEPPHLP